MHRAVNHFTNAGVQRRSRDEKGFGGEHLMAATIVGPIEKILNSSDSDVVKRRIEPIHLLDECLALVT